MGHTPDLNQPYTIIVHHRNKRSACPDIDLSLRDRFLSRDLIPLIAYGKSSAYLNIYRSGSAGMHG